MKKVFVSLPMADRSKEDILEIQEKCRHIAETMLNESAVLIQTYFEYESPEYVNNHSVFCLGHSISLLSSADIVVFAPGSRKCRGCKVERLVANLYKIPTIDLSTYGVVSTSPAMYTDNKI